MNKIFKIFAIIFYLITLFLSLSFPAHNVIYIYLFLFAILYWQKEKIRSVFISAKGSKKLFIFLFISIIWAIFLNIFLAVLPFNPNPLINTLISFGFYIPYFLFWYLLFKRGIFSYLNVFYLSGLSGVIFDLFFTHKTVQTVALQGYDSMVLALIAFTARLIIVFTIYGVLTILPYSLVFAPPKMKRKGVMVYFLALVLPIATLPFFLIWRKIISVICYI